MLVIAQEEKNEKEIKEFIPYKQTIIAGFEYHPVKGVGCATQGN